MSSQMQGRSQPNYKFWLLSAFLVLVFLLGGSSHKDVQSLAILRPASILLCALALTTLHFKDVNQYRAIFLLFGMIVMLTVFYLVPLPPAIASFFQPLDLVRSINAEIGITTNGQAISADPTESWDTLYSLATPMAVLLLAVQLPDRDKYRLLPLLIVLSCISGVLGILQLLSSPTGPLYFYNITHSGSAVGLFANRNHSATLLACVFPMLAVFAAGTGRTDNLDGRKILAAAIALVVLPLILVTGSRSGFVAAIFGCLGALFLLPKGSEKLKSSKSKKFFRKYQTFIIGASAFFILVSVTLLFSRGFALERLFTEMPGSDGRKDFVVISAKIFTNDFFWGAGPGALANVYKIYEPFNLLDATFLNRAHNDYVETLVTYGALGLLLFGFVALYVVWKAAAHWIRSKSQSSASSFGRMASLVICIMAIASVSDYPLRTPTMMSVMAIVFLWMSGSNSTFVQKRTDEGKPALARRS